MGLIIKNDILKPLDYYLRVYRGLGFFAVMCTDLMTGFYQCNTAKKALEMYIEQNKLTGKNIKAVYKGNF